MPVTLLEIRAKVGDLDRWDQHIAAPFSPDSLADPDKPYITVGDFIFPPAMCPSDEPDQDWLVNKPIAKFANEEGLLLQCLSNVCTRRRTQGECRGSALIRDLNLGFERAARYILGSLVYEESSVDLTLWRRKVPRGIGQEPDLHLDIDNEEDDRRLMGLISDVLPTEILLNPTCQEDYDGGYLRSVMGVPLEEANLRTRRLPAGKLAILPMSIPHRGQIPSADVPRRHFMRWWADH